MEKKFKNQKGREFILCLVPSDAYDISIGTHCVGVRTNQDLPKDSNGWQHVYSDGLFFGSYKTKIVVVCLAKDATEEQAASVVDKKQGVLNYFYDYEFKFYSYNSCAIKSLTSLLTSLGFKQDDNVLILEKI